MTIQIDAMQASDWPFVNDIHQEGIDTGLASFAENAPDWDEWDGSYLENGRFTAKFQDQVVGWAALSPVSSN